jgi:plastocyanin
MVRKLPFILFLMLAISISAQNTTTFNIDWSYNSTPSSAGPANSNRTIEVGDKVIWNWYSNGSHNVKSNSSSTESFESAFFGTGGAFSHTFTTVGTNSYVCTPHSDNMFGTITVVAEGTLSIDAFDALSTINMYPNPTSANLTIDFKIQNTEKLNIKVFNLLGKEVLSKQISKNDVSVEVSSLNDGIYIVRITSLDGQNSITKRFVKN